MTTYEEKKKELLNRWGASKWLKEQIVVGESRDILDMLNDIEELQELLMLKWDKSLPNTE